MNLSDQQRSSVRQIVAETLKIDIRRVVDEAKLYVDLNLNANQLEVIKTRVNQELSTNLALVFETVQSLVVEKDFQLTKDSMQSILEYLGPWPKLQKKRVSYSALLTVGMLEAIVAKALELGLPPVADNGSAASEASAHAVSDTSAAGTKGSDSQSSRTLDQVLDEPADTWLSGGPHLRGLAAEDRAWWSTLPTRIGIARLRLLLVGMLRHAFVQSGALTESVERCLNTAEKFAETDTNWDQREERLRGVKSWKLGRNRLWSGLIPILEADLTSDLAGEVLSIIGLAHGWEPDRVFEEFKQFYRSIDSEGLEKRISDAWKTKPIVKLCKEMHRSRDFTRMLDLDTLLRSAGCSDPSILDYVNDAKVKHIRGDWLVMCLMKSGEDAVADLADLSSA